MPSAQETYRKSLLFEIVNKANLKPVESFILSIPPETIEIEEPQRTKITKTYGGVFIDDFGPDTLKITISGSTGGSNVVKTMVNNAKQELTGKMAFFQFRNSIMRYKSEIADYENYEMHLYDLSASDLVGWRSTGIGSEIIPVHDEGYTVILKKFKMRRSKERPFFYNYTIELEGIHVLGTYAGGVAPPITMPSPQSLIVNVRKALGSVQTFFNDFEAIQSEIESVFDLVDSVSTKVVAFFDQGMDLVIYPLELCKRALSSVKTLFDNIQAVSDSVYETEGIAKRDAYEINEIMKELMAGSAALVAFGKTPEASGNVVIKEITELTKIESLDKRYAGLTDIEAQISDYYMPVDVTEKENATVYGYTLVVPDSTTTLESLAVEHFGNADFLTYIAALNNFQGDEDIVIGEPIKVPVLIQGGTLSENYIFSEVVNDIYGTDMRIDANGNIVVSASGDFATLEGPSNLIQALNLRLNEALGSRLRLSVYGIRNAVGGAMNDNAPISYIVTNIKDTMMQDPRVNEIIDMKIRGRGDALDISFNVETIKVGELIPFVGSV